MPQVPVLILGCGYTGRRVAAELLRRGATVVATTRSGQPPVAGLDTRRLEWPHVLDPGPLPPEVAVVHSIPVIEGPADPTADLLAVLGARPTRIIYLSTTAVYGTAAEVDERTPAAPELPSAYLRLAAERLVQAGPWSSLVLRPAAIYGPDRGVHVRLAQGTYRPAGDGGNFVSRFHVDDLAALIMAALESELTGAYPVADDEPCTSLEIARFSAALLGLSVPAGADPVTLHETRRVDRRVNGRAIREALGVSLRYPTYREGIRGAIEQS